MPDPFPDPFSLMFGLFAGVFWGGTGDGHMPRLSPDPEVEPSGMMRGFEPGKERVLVMYFALQEILFERFLYLLLCVGMFCGLCWLNATLDESSQRWFTTTVAVCILAKFCPNSIWRNLW